jgi:SSS family solute:Na+ symporter
MIEGRWIIISMAVVYLVTTTVVGMRSYKYSKTSAGLMQSKGMIGPVVIGFLMMSEFLGTGTVMGTPQTAFMRGIWAGWSVLTLSLGYLLYAFTMASKYQASGEHTITGVLGKMYGRGTQMSCSALMLFITIAMDVSLYEGSGATIAKVMGISIKVGIIIVAVACALVTATGGLRGAGFSSLIHITMKYMGLILASIMAFVLMRKAHLSLDMLPAKYWQPEGLGWGTIVAWPLANIGAVFSTQYVIQSISSLQTPAEARKASLISSLGIIPVAILTTYIGLCAKVLFPNISSINALPEFIAHMSPWLGWIIVCCILGSGFVAMLAWALGASAIIMNDFIIPYAKPTEKQGLYWARAVSIAIALIPIPFALYVPELLKVLFLTRAVRLSFAVVAIFGFYAPLFNSKKGAMWSLILAGAATISWYFLFNVGPLGGTAVAGVTLKHVDNIYIAGLVPLLVLVIDHFVVKRKDAVASDVPSKNSAKAPVI